MRRNIALNYGEQTKIYFYTHWDAEFLDDILRVALLRGRDRWDDPSYLARIIFCEMIRNSVLEDTGYGIAPYPIDPEFPTIEVDLRKETVDGKPFDQFVHHA
jgi:hypothetical protein